MKNLSKSEFLIKAILALCVSGLFIYLGEREEIPLLKEIAIFVFLFIVILFSLSTYKVFSVSKIFLTAIIFFLFINILHSPQIKSFTTPFLRIIISTGLIYALFVWWFISAWRDKSFSFRSKKIMISTALVVGLLITVAFGFSLFRSLPGILNKYTEEEWSIDVSQSLLSHTVLVSIIPALIMFFIGISLGIFLMEWLVFKWTQGFIEWKQPKRKLKYKDIKDNPWIKGT